MPLDDAAKDTAHARFAVARSRSVFLATPIARHPTRQYCMALAQTFAMLAEVNIRGYVQTVVGSSNLPRARNEIVAAFLASDFSDLLWIDDDMGWDPADVVRLLASDKLLIGGVGAKKRLLPDTNPNKWCVRFDYKEGVRQDAMGAMEVTGVGTGFLKVNRAVFEQMIAAHPEWKRNGYPEMAENVRAHYYGFYRFGGEAEEWGEDFNFCNEYRAIGGTCWVDPTIRLVHVGEYEYTGDFEALFERSPPCASSR
jgi:hypothetical protein